MKIKRFFEMFEDKYDYTKIVDILRKNYGWGIGILSSVDEFESNDEYFTYPETDDEYAEEFNVYLTDVKVGRMRGELDNTTSLRLGQWSTGIQVDKPVSIYNRLY
jgi:hypothetical protein